MTVATSHGTSTTSAAHDGAAVPTDRRALLRRLATVGAATAAATTVPAVLGGADAVLAADGSAGVDGTAEDTAASAVDIDPDPDLHLLRRATFGPTTRSLEELREVGRDAWLDRQLDPESIREDGGLWPALGRFSMRTRSVVTIRETAPAAGGQWAADLLLAEAAMVRAVWSRRQLFEKVVELWTDHLNIARIDAYDGLRTVRDRELREVALGPFRDLLQVDAASPAMLVYLDQSTSDASSPNENYGRELLELHTVGIDGGYSEDDVRNAALVFTGWTIDRERYTFTYDPEMHHVGPVRVMDWQHDNADAADGEAVGRSLLTYLAEHPATARMVATKMARHFVADDPPEDLVERLAQVYLDNDTDVRPVLKALFTDPAFEASVGGKVRRPIDQLAAATRAMGRRAGPRVLRGYEDRVFAWMAGRMGQEPMAWPAPDGYPHTASAWLSTSRMSASIRMMNGLVWGDHDGLLDDAGEAFDRFVRDAVGQPASELVQVLARQLVLQEVDSATSDALLAMVETEPDRVLEDLEQVRWRAHSMARVLLMSPYALQH